MSMKLLRDRGLVERLERIDEDLAEAARREPCQFCGAGRLHRGDYPRKPRGYPGLDDRGPARRRSFCCSRKGCRRRTTPPSVRFLGRKVYLGVVVTLVSAMAHGLTAGRMRKLREELGVDRRTVERWRVWWRETFVETAFWKAFRGSLMPPVDEAFLPLSLWERFGRTARGIVGMMRAISPVTAAPGGGGVIAAAW
jgi:hypothetical protein